MCVCMRVEEGGGVYSGERGVYSSWGGSCLSQVMDTVSYCVALMNTVSYCVVVVVVVVVLMDTVSYGVALMDAVLYSVLLRMRHCVVMCVVMCWVVMCVVLRCPDGYCVVLCCSAQREGM